MSDTHRIRLARECYEAYVRDDRSVLETLLDDDFVFYSPDDDGIDRATYFERCWPNHETVTGVDFNRMIEAENEVIVTCELTRTDGRRSRNTEILTFEHDMVVKQEVYFGWEV